MNGKQTAQRLTDLIDVAQNSEVKLLAKIMRDYADHQTKANIGFKTEIEETKKERSDARS